MWLSFLYTISFTVYFVRYFDSTTISPLPIFSFSLCLSLSIHLYLVDPAHVHDHCILDNIITILMNICPCGWWYFLIITSSYLSGKTKNKSWMTSLLSFWKCAFQWSRRHVCADDCCCSNGKSIKVRHHNFIYFKYEYWNSFFYFFFDKLSAFDRVQKPEFVFIRISFSFRVLRFISHKCN